MVNLQQYTQRSEVGAIKPWGKSTAPDGYVLCDGASLARAGTYADLFAVIGTTYGTADGSSFNVPNLQGKTPQGYDGNTYNLAATGGANTVTVSVTNNQGATNTNNQAVSLTGTISNTSLTTAQLASHTHDSQYGGSFPGSEVSWKYPYEFGGPNSLRTPRATQENAGSGTGHNHAHTLSGTLTGTVTTSLTGAVTASGTNTFSPYVVVNYIIKH